MAYSAKPSDKPGYTQVIDGLDTLTVAGLIAELQRHIEIDPERADQPVEFWSLGGNGNKRYLPAIVAASGNRDPKIGGHLKVALIGTRSPAWF